MNRRRLPHALAFAALLCLAQEDKGPAILRPAVESVLKPGELSVVARVAGASELLVDGRRVPIVDPLLLKELAGVLRASGQVP